MAAECGVARHPCLLLLGLLLLQQHQPVLSGAVCRLGIEGYGSKQGIKSMQLACSGGSITAALHPSMLGSLTRSFSGVVWSDKGACGKLRSNCALTICGDSKATFVGASIAQVNASKLFSYVLCIGDNSDLLFHRAECVRNTAVVISAAGQNVKLHISSSSLSNNTTPGTQHTWGVLHLVAGSVVVQSSRVQGNVATGDCGIICASGNSSLQLESAVLVNNKGANNGGAVSALDHAHIFAHNCSFSNNGADFGGAMLLFTSTLGNISRCNFTSNYAMRTGGAIYVSGSARASIQYSSFKGNAAQMYGGALGLWMHANVDVTGVNFSGNTAVEAAGAVMVDGSATLTVVHASLEHSSARQGSTVCVGGNSSMGMRHVKVANNQGLESGTILAGNNATVRLMDVVFGNNTAQYGAALCCSDDSNIHVESCMIANNTAGEAGGGVYLNGRAGATILDSKMTGNRVGSDAGFGGALYADGYARVNLTRTQMLWNAAGFGGGFLVAEDSLLTARGVVMMYNSAAQDGAGVFVQGRGVVGIEHSQLLLNTASNRGGAIALFERATCDLLGCLITQNSATSGGALFMGGSMTDINVTHQDGVRLTVHNSTLRSNVAHEYGGALCCYGHGAATFVGGLIANSSAKAGGAVAMAEQSAVVVKGFSQGFGNSADQGGFLYVSDNASAHMSDASFVHNWVKQNGAGGLVKASGSSVVSVKNCRAVGGVLQPDVFGGAVYLDQRARLDISGSTLSDYNAARGAGVALFEDSTVHGRDCIMVNMNAKYQGGGLLITGSAQGSWVGGKFARTSAMLGGALGVTGASWISVHGVIFENATGHDGGGAVFGDMTAAIRLTNCRFQSCQSSTAFNSGSSGGAVLVDGMASAHLTNCIITRCRSMFGGAVAATNNARLQLQECALSNNTVIMNGGAVVLENQAQFVAQGCIFSHDRCGGVGGGLTARTAASMHLQHCRVANNSAAEVGGGISLVNTAALAMVQTTITGNSALGGGGGVALASSNFVWDEVQTAVHGNTAMIAPDVMVWPIQLAVVNNSSVENFVSRMGSDEGLVNVALNVTGAQGLPAEGVSLLALLDGVVVQQTNSGADGIAHMHVKLRKPPGLYVLNFTLGGNINPDVPAVQVQVHVVNCTQGDITVSTGDACQTCARGQYSFDPRNSTCDQCVLDAECPGGAAVLALPGFWLSSPRSVQVHRCFNQDACLGGDHAAQQAQSQDYKSAQCADSYHGNLCAVCQDGYGTMKLFTCRPCMKPAATVTLYALAAVAMLVAVRVLSAFTLAEAGPASTIQQATPVDLLKPLVLYLQWLFVVVGLNGVPWPPSLSVPLQALAWFWSTSSANSLGLDCVLPHHAKLPVAMQKVLFGLLMPLAILLVLLCFDLLLTLCARRRSKRWLVRQVSLRDRCSSLLLCMAFIFLPTWMHAIFSLFTCVPLDVEAAFPYAAEAVGSYWAQDMGAQCYAGYHRGWALGLGVPLLVLFCFVLPSGLFAFMYVSRQQGKLGQTSFRKQYGFLYRTWREPVCWWEAVVVLQTIVLVMIGTFGYALGPYYQSLVITAALAVIGVLLMAVQPHCCTAARVVSLRSVGP